MRDGGIAIGAAGTSHGSLYQMTPRLDEGSVDAHRLGR